MKNLAALLLLSALAFSSCKKDRVCNCTVSTIGLTTTHAVSEAAGVDTTFVTPLNTRDENKSTLRKVTKRRAKNNCIKKDDDFSERTNNNIPGFFSLSITNSGTREYDCKLQ